MGKTLACTVDDLTYMQVIQLAKNEGIVHKNSGAVNESEMLRQLIKAGLGVMGEHTGKPTEG